VGASSPSLSSHATAFEVALIAVAALLTRPFALALGFIDQLLIKEHRRFL
jgi:hypothetical protein